MCQTHLDLLDLDGEGHAIIDRLQAVQVFDVPHLLGHVVGPLGVGHAFDMLELGEGFDVRHASGSCLGLKVVN